MTAAPSTKGQLIYVIVGNMCRGFLYRRRDKFEVFDIDLISRGVCPDEQSVIAALFKAPSKVSAS